jgi:hypothetical protein
MKINIKYIHLFLLFVVFVVFFIALNSWDNNEKQQETPEPEKYTCNYIHYVV